MSEASGPPDASPTTREVALLLAEIGTLFELNGRDSFRAKAFLNAARALEGTDADLAALAEENRLESLRGIGPAIASIITEYLLTGRSPLYDELRAATPLALYDLLRVQGLGAKRIHTLHQSLGIEDLDGLEAAARAGRIASLPGFGSRTEAKILAGIEFARTNRQLRRYPDALEVAVRLLEWIREQPGVGRAEIVGSLRRRMEIVDQIDLLAATRSPAKVLGSFARLHGAGAPEPDHPDEASLVLSDGMTVRLRCVSAGDFEGALVWETGSEGHLHGLVALADSLGMSLSRAGLARDGGRVPVPREGALYEKLGIAYIPPELREGLGEVEAASSKGVPTLVELSNLRGTFHCHTTASDGKATLEEMAAGARDRGWAYLGTGDHSRNAGYAGGLSIAEVRQQHVEIDELNRRLAAEGGPPLHIFKGIESDILNDGSLDYPDDVLASFDYVVGSVHSSFRMEEAVMTRRMVRAIRHPALTILGHPTGRLLLTRSGYSLDLPEVLRAAAKAGVVIEINANPHRLDLDWRDVREAAAMGILIAINPDAHSVSALDHVVFGVNMARKAGLEARQVLNTWPLEAVKEHFEKRKQKIQA